MVCGKPEGVCSLLRCEYPVVARKRWGAHSEEAKGDCPDELGDAYRTHHPGGPVVLWLRRLWSNAGRLPQRGGCKCNGWRGHVAEPNGSMMEMPGRSPPHSSSTVVPGATPPIGHPTQLLHHSSDKHALRFCKASIQLFSFYISLQRPSEQSWEFQCLMLDPWAWIVIQASLCPRLGPLRAPHPWLI